MQKWENSPPLRLEWIAQGAIPDMVEKVGKGAHAHSDRCAEVLIYENEAHEVN